MPTTRASAANHSGDEVAEKPDLASKASPAKEISSAEFSNREVLPPGDKTPLRATSVTKAIKSTGINRALRARQALRFIRSEHIQKTDEAHNVIQTADPGFYSLQALAGSQVGNDNEEDWPSSWVHNKGTFQSWTKNHLKKWLTVDLPPHLAQKARELRSADKNAKKMESKARDELAGETSTKPSEIPSTTSKEQELAMTNKQSPPPTTTETSDISVGAASKITTMARTPNAGTSSLGAYPFIEQEHVEKGPGGSIRVDKKKDVPDFVDVSITSSSTSDHPLEAPVPPPPAAAPAHLESSTQDDMPRFGQVPTPGSQSTLLPIRVNTNVSISNFPDLNTARDSSAGSLHAEKMPTSYQQGHVPFAIQGSLSMPGGPLKPTSPPTIRVPVETDDTPSHYDGRFCSGPSFKTVGSLSPKIPAKTDQWTEKKTEETLLETSARPFEPGMAADIGEFGSADHQGGNAYNVIGELTKVNLERHEDFSLQNGSQIEEGEGVKGEDPPAEWYEWYKKYHAEQREKLDEVNGQ
ncbi:hypothetical protein Neosp_015109 [[Neocosmospora] mangrovei]